MKQTTAVGSPRLRSRRRHDVGDALFLRVTQAFALAMVAVVLLALGVTARSAWPAVRAFGLGFLTGSTWDPVADKFGAWPFVWGTLYSSFLALLLAVPVGVAGAIFLSELSPRWLSGPVSFLVELLAAIPSVVYGLWGLLVMVPWLRDRVQAPLNGALGNWPLFSGAPYGVSMMAAALVLAIMILPIITAVARDVLRAVPREQREAALALGSTRWETIWRAVLPFGRVGVLGAVILALGRALGETMAVTMVIGNRPEASISLLNPAYTMASVLANEYAEATGRLHVAALSGVALTLFVITFIVNGLARWLVWRVAHRAGGSR
ncbi:MAG: phosphate ABC transporter permease subunit PstC [Armatimonadetes bacterium]|nr:phosphate ABC transporter permease subunit PstC [Armatimonadota bacterium]